MIKSLAKASAMFASVAALTAVGAVASTGAAVANACPSGALCAYTSTNYGGDPGTVYGNNTNLLQYTKFDNAASVSNSGTQCSVRIYGGTSYSGPNVLIPRGYGYSNLETQNAPLYRNVASNYWC